MRKRAAVDRDHLAASLVCAGAVLGLVAMTPIALSFAFAPFGPFGEIAFVFVLALGILLFSKRPIGRVAAAASAWFAVFGGAVSVAFLLFGLIVPSGSLVSVSAVGIVAMGISVAGAIVKIRAPS